MDYKKKIKELEKEKSMIHEQLNEAEGKIRAATEAMDRLIEYKTEFKPNWPKTAFWGKNGYSKGDEDTPFFSECFLYNLIGKDDARSVRGSLHRIMESLGMNTMKL